MFVAVAGECECFVCVCVMEGDIAVEKGGLRFSPCEEFTRVVEDGLWVFVLILYVEGDMAVWYGEPTVLGCVGVPWHWCAAAVSALPFRP